MAKDNGDMHAYCSSNSANRACEELITMRDRQLLTCSALHELYNGWRDNLAKREMLHSILEQRCSRLGRFLLGST